MNDPASSAPLVSVIITCFNYGRFVSEAIESVLRQSYCRVEVIVVDDGSTDDSAARIADYESKVQYIWQQNSGLSSARNAGIKAAMGEFIVCLDADDTLEPTYIERLMEAIEHDSSIAICFAWGRCFGTSTSPISPPDHNPALLWRKNYIPANALLRRVALPPDPYDERLTLFEDWDLYLRLTSAGWNASRVPEPLWRYRRHEASMLADARRSRRLERSRHVVRSKNWTYRAGLQSVRLARYPIWILRERLRATLGVLKRVGRFAIGSQSNET